MFRTLALRLEDRNLLTILKLAEVRLLGRYSSTYCYNFPSHILLELTARCNLKCAWCVQADEGFRDGYREDMPFELFEEIIPKLKGAKVIHLNVNGEPLLYGRIFEAIELARKYVPSVRLITNGILLDREASMDLKRAGLSQLGVSIDSTDERMMSKIRNISLEEVTENIKLFCESTQIPVEIRSVICEENINDLEVLPDYASRFSTCHFIYFVLAEGIKEVESSSMTMLKSKAKFMDFRETVVEGCKKMGLRTNLEFMEFYAPGFFEQRRRGRCEAIFGKHLAINSKGYIMPCCLYWGNHLEHLGKLSFDEAWNGRQTRGWRRRMLQARYTDYCSNYCGYARHNTKGG